MRTIWKYKLLDGISPYMPKGAEILSVHDQQGDVCIWALVDPDAEREQRHFAIYGTGHDVDDGDFRFIGTVLIMDESLVLHVFEKVAAGAAS